MGAFDGDRPPGFACELIRAQNTVTARLHGELDVVTSEQAQRALEDALGADQSGQRLVIDLRDLRFIDSTGIRLLLRWDAASRADGFSVELVQGPEQIQRIFELVGLQRHFSFVEPAS